jgi:phosphatidylglycerol---prolipoprotein diacylglyceryl transferase
MTLALMFPAIDPVALEIGPLSIRWYALAYVAGLLLGWLYLRHLARRLGGLLSPRQADDLLVWVTLGVILGGRIGHVLFYKPGYYIDHPVEIFYVWQGGMSFHGGLLGVGLALILFARRHKVSGFAAADLVTCAVPLGLMFGRLANFINGELFGRASNVSWAMVFPRGGDVARHPSQLYEAALEGLFLFLLLFTLSHASRLGEQPGRLAGVFGIGYGIARIVAELFREPDAHLGFIVGGITMGQILSLPMILIGVWLILRTGERPRGPSGS